MSPKAAKYKNRFIFDTDLKEAQQYREYCFRENITLQEGLREALVDYLIKVGEIPNRESLSAEEEMSK
jgi:hypothetical protein